MIDIFHGYLIIHISYGGHIFAAQCTGSRRTVTWSGLQPPFAFVGPSHANSNEHYRAGGAKICSHLQALKLRDSLPLPISRGQSLHGTVGSPFYIAPEVLSGGYDQAADVWSAGVILYILLSGVPPFWGQTKSRIFDAVRQARLEFPKGPWRGISASAVDLISKMLCTDPKKRLTSVQVLEHPWISSPLELSKHIPFRRNEKDGILCSSLKSLEPETISSFRLLAAGNPKIELQPSFCVQSSFSGFFVGSQVSQLSGSFVFDRCTKSNGSECSAVTPTILSFAFANVDGAFSSEHSSYPPDNKVQSHCSHRESSFGHLFVAAVSNSIRSVSQYVMSVEEPTSETRKVGTSTSRYLISHRGNRTIGLGELEQLDLKVSDSIIRWASCTRLSSATSFQSSLVC
ncbi:hypothetical protein SUGI_1206070 [Cryptomeria japonica]|nr:hypothetical protein SUGI_1206070 [Cryptomeria japonica]